MKASEVFKVIGAVGVAIVLFIVIIGSWKLITALTNPHLSEKPRRGLDEAIFLYPRNLSTTELSRNSTKFFVVLDSYKIFARPYFATNETLTEIKITNSSDFSSNFTKQLYNKGFTSDCSNKKIYLLKKFNSTQSFEQVLYVIQYDDNNNFQIIKRVPNMFNGAVSIASDWTTGNIYWIDYNEYYQSSIKVTNKFFDEPEYVVQPSTDIRDIQVYPKKKEIFFIQVISIWYTSTTSRNSTPKPLFSSFIESFNIDHLVIDYELDKLCFLYSDDFLNCIDIDNSTRPINAPLINSQKDRIRANNFAVANNAFYWMTYNNLLSNNVNGTPHEIADTSGYGNFILSFFSSNCSCEPNDNETLETTTILSSKEIEAAANNSLPLKFTEKETV